MNNRPLVAAGVFGSLAALSLSVLAQPTQPRPPVQPSQPNQPAQPSTPPASQPPSQPTQPNTVPPEPASPNQPQQPNTTTPNQQNPNQPPAQPNQPGTLQPAQPGTIQPGNLNPGNGQNGNGLLPEQLRLLDPSDPSLTNEQRASLLRLRSQRPFNFQSPAHEAQFNQNTQQLLRMEQRFEKSTQDHLRRLGEIRNLGPEKQNAALLDLLQQMLQDRVELQRYLADSRSMLTGDVSLPTDSAPSSGDTRPAKQQAANQPADANRQTNVPAPGSNTNPPR